jgi:hypothetical protein
MTRSIPALVLGEKQPDRSVGLDTRFCLLSIGAQEQPGLVRHVHHGRSQVGNDQHGAAGEGNGVVGLAGQIGHPSQFATAEPMMTSQP